MNAIKKHKHTIRGIEILRALATDGHHIFTLQEAVEEATRAGISQSYVVEALSLLKHDGWIEGLKRGLYAFTHGSGIFEPPHEFEIAQALVPNSAISYWTAMRHYQMTEQLPQTTFSMVPDTASLPRHSFDRRFCYVRTKRAHLFGITTVWINQIKIRMTDPERTLLAGLRHPEYCGGFREVLSAYKACFDRIEINRLIEYSIQLEAVISKRLGWILEQLGAGGSVLENLQKAPMKGPRKLDPTSTAHGKYNARWQLQENL